MNTFTDWDIVRNLLLAARWTVLLSLTAFVGGALMTLPLLLLRLTRRRWPQRLVRGYTELFQGTPLLMQLFLAFFGPALFGIDLSPWAAAALALTLYSSAFLVDIWYGSIRALPPGQGTALASIIGFVELTKAATILTNVTYQPFRVFALVALGYFLMCYPLSRYSQYLEKKCHAAHHH
ncbi:MAG: ABC transporter permease subunit [Pantoea sp.]|nr:ABC transporter permease subunit [Pantoea sp.]